MTLLTQPPENVKISFIHRVSDAPIHFPSFKVATGNHSVFGVATSKMPCLQELSAIGSHSSHVTTGILFIWEKFKIVLPDSNIFPVYVHVCLQNSGYCGYPGYPVLFPRSMVYNCHCGNIQLRGRAYCEISCSRRMPSLKPLMNPSRSCSQHRSFTVSMIVFARSVGRPFSRRFKDSLTFA